MNMKERWLECCLKHNWMHGDVQSKFKTLSGDIENAEKLQPIAVISDNPLNISKCEEENDTRKEQIEATRLLGLAREYDALHEIKQQQQKEQEIISLETDKSTEQQQQQDLLTEIHSPKLSTITTPPLHISQNALKIHLPQLIVRSAPSTPEMCHIEQDQNNHQSPLSVSFSQQTQVEEHQPVRKEELTQAHQENLELIPNEMELQTTLNDKHEQESSSEEENNEDDSFLCESDSTSSGDEIQNGQQQQQQQQIEDNEVDELEEKIRYVASSLIASSNTQQSMAPTTLLTPSAKKHLLSRFHREREALAHALHIDINNKVFNGKLSPEVLSVSWSTTLNKTAGTCEFVQSESKAKVLIAIKVCDSFRRLRSTLCHEMCHAAVMLIDKQPQAPYHGKLFKKWGKEVQRLYKVKVETTHHYAIHYKFVFSCSNCGARYGRHSKSLDVANTRCTCGGILSLIETKGKRSNNNNSDFIAFTKENYATLRRNNSEKSHTEIMELLSQMWRQKKEQGK